MTTIDGSAGRHPQPDLDVGDEIVVATETTIYTYLLDTAGDAWNLDLDDTW